MTKFVVLGADGMLGRAFREVLTSRDASFVAWNRSEFDVTSDARIARGFGEADAVINCSAYTNVDQAESEEELATRINGTAVGALAQKCASNGISFVHFSTDYVFDGEASVPYPVDAPRAPINAYGRSKALGEELLETSGASFLLIRTSWVYAPWGKNFVTTMANLLRTKPSVRVVDDQRGRPTSALQLARNTLGLIERGVLGVRHVTDAGECSWFEFATEIERQLATKCHVEPCRSFEFPRPAARPAYSVLDSSSTEQDLGPSASFIEELSVVLSRLDDPRTSL